MRLFTIFAPKVRVSFPEALTDTDSVPIILEPVDGADDAPVDETDPPEGEEPPPEDAVALAVVLKATSVEAPALVSSIVYVELVWKV